MPEAAGTMSQSTPPDTAQDALIPAIEVARQTPPQEAPNGIRFAAFSDTGVEPDELARLVQAIPASIAAALSGIVYYFVPLAMAETRDIRRTADPATPADTLIAPAFTPELAEFAICHRNVPLDPVSSETTRDGVFISTRLLSDRFSLAFELFINAGHAFVDIAGVPAPFSELVWAQAIADVRGETSQDAWDHRAAALQPRRSGAHSSNQPGGSEPDEQAKSAFLQAAFSDAVAIYLLSLATDFDYAELRERDYPLLAPQALADRLRHINRLFPANPGYEFAIRYRRRA